MTPEREYSGRAFTAAVSRKRGNQIPQRSSPTIAFIDEEPTRKFSCFGETGVFRSVGPELCIISMLDPSSRNRKFESTSLQQRVGRTFGS